MASVNKFIGIGHLGKDPEARYLPSGEAISNFSIACSESWKDKQTGEKKEVTEWVRISVFGKLAEICNQYLKKGSLAYIEGSLRTRKWTDKDGVERYSTEIRAESMRMLGGRDGDTNRSPSPPQSNQGARHGVADQNYAPAPERQKPKPSFDDLDDNIPF